MSTFPFGFSPGSGTGDAGDLAGKIPLFAELQRLLASDGPVNWELARQVAIAGAAQHDPAVNDDDASAVCDALRLADLWLDDATSLPAGVTQGEAWSRVR
ncbi:MAG: zinc-dependent metalloprotease, partial [Mycobacteriales bacterium]